MAECVWFRVQYFYFPLPQRVWENAVGHHFLCEKVMDRSALSGAVGKWKPEDGRHGTNAIDRMPAVKITTAAEGSLVLTGGTYEFRQAIKERGGRWSVAERSWTLPAGTDVGFLKPAPAPVPPTAAASGGATAAARPLLAVFPPVVRRDRLGRCCAAAQTEFDAVCPQGPMWWVCAAHGRERSTYAGC